MEEDPVPANIEPDPDFDGDNLSEDSDNDDNQQDIDPVPDSEEKEIIGKYLLYLRSSTRATNKDVLKILEKMQEIVKWYVEHKLHDVRDALQEALDNRFDDIINIREIVNEINCSQGLHSIHNQNIYFGKKFNVVQPRKIELGDKFVPYGTAPIDGNQPIKIQKDELIFIPITETLSNWITSGSYGDVTLLRTRRQDRISETFMDGTYFQNHEYRRLRPNCKFIRFYFDEVDMCDAVGAKSSSTNKLGMFYWIDEDVSPKYKSQLKFINLAGIVPNPHIKSYGMNSILQHFVDDMKKLENGLQLPNNEIVYGTMSVASGDNPAIQEMFYFKKSASASHPCRVCKASSEQVRTMSREDVTILRTPQEHDQQVAEIERLDGNEKEAKKTAYGINGRSVLNQIQGFHVATSAPPDLVHDDFEGMCVLTTKLFLTEVCFVLKLISLDEVNEKIKHFDYGYAEKTSKPSTISSIHVLDPSAGFKQTASQMAQLVFMLPLILSDKIPQEWPPLQNYIKMLEIIVISHADKIEDSMFDYLNSCVAEYLHTFQTIYRRGLVPKQHSLVHRVSFIIKFGPLGQYKTMRAEGKHQYFKRIAQCMRNYKNLPLTLARKHQLYQAYILENNLEREISTGPITWMPINLLDFNHLFPEVRRLQITKWAEMYGQKYVSLKCFLAVGYTVDNLPEFVALYAIVLRDNNPIFVCKKVAILEHDMTVMAYAVQISDEFVTYTLNDLLTPQVFHSHKYYNKQYIILKKALGNLH